MERRHAGLPAARALGMGALLVMMLFASPSPAASDLAGRWRVEKRDAIIQVERIGDAFVGHVVWAKDRDGIRGEERLDTKNPRPELRSRKVLGLTMLTGVSTTPRADGWHTGGRIYNPKTGKSYPVKVRLESPDRLRLRVGGSVVGQTTFWTRTD
jgi:uncharacterized protein (DUF2147 family)